MFRPALLSLLICAFSAYASEILETQSIRIGNQQVSLEIARTSVQQRTGLMHRASLPENGGMLFVFTSPRPVTMWMKNTLMDLDAAFINACGCITNIAGMKMGTLDLHQSRGNVLHVIEMERGWFANHRISPGTCIPALRNPKYCSSPEAVVSERRLPAE